MAQHRPYLVEDRSKTCIFNYMRSSQEFPAVKPGETGPAKYQAGKATLLSTLDNFKDFVMENPHLQGMDKTIVESKFVPNLVL